MNNHEMHSAIKATYDKMMRWPRWYFRFQLWRHRKGWIATMLKESGAIDIIMERMNTPRSMR
jgi:hypothetical protein